jgi:hypothetical protein
VAHVVATFGVLLEQPFFYVREDDVRLDLPIVVISGFAITPGVVDFDILV